MEIEQLAAERPEALAKVEVDPLVGIDSAKAQEIVEAAGFSAELQPKVVEVLVKLGDVFKKEDATLVEVNPLVQTPKAIFWLLTVRSLSTITRNSASPITWRLSINLPKTRWKLKAKQHDLNYVKLDGEVGVVGNGAGLVMSTLAWWHTLAKSTAM